MILPLMDAGITTLTPNRIEYQNQRQNRWQIQ